MKNLLTFALLMLCLALGAKQAEPVGQDLLSSALDAAVQSLDNLMLDTLGSLELIAATPEAKQGDWQGLKPCLQKLEQSVPAVYFYVLPDGNYYSVEQGFTNLNLSSREYFPSLLAGQQVLGFPIYSRSTNRRAGLLACPIVVGGKVTGALGASVFLDDLQQRIQNELQLPENSTWFVVNSAGLTMLDRETDYIFMNALTEGGSSLKNALEQAFQAEQGNIRYELGGIVRQGWFRKLPNLDWWMVMASKEGEPSPPDPKLEFSLGKFAPELQATLNRIDKTIASNLQKAKDSPRSEQDMRKLLAAIYREEESVLNACFIDGKGSLRYAEPPEYKNLEGSDLNSQEHVADMIKRPRPMLSKGFISVEGFYAVVICHPVYGSNAEFTGYVSVLLRPDLIVRKLLAKLNIPPEHDMWIMQTDGQIVYDRDAKEIGLMLFSDPLYAPYENLLKLGRNIAAKPSGTGEYIFESSWGQEKVIKQASWDTVKLHGTEWRVVLTYYPYKN